MDQNWAERRFIWFFFWLTRYLNPGREGRGENKYVFFPENDHHVCGLKIHPMLRAVKIYHDHLLVVINLFTQATPKSPLAHSYMCIKYVSVSLVSVLHFHFCLLYFFLWYFWRKMFWRNNFLEFQYFTIIQCYFNFVACSPLWLLAAHVKCKTWVVREFVLWYSEIIIFYIYQYIKLFNITYSRKSKRNGTQFDRVHIFLISYSKSVLINCDCNNYHFF